jgi:hypothetical protein
MRITDLPSPGIYVNSQRLRIEAVKAISACEIAANASGGTVDSAVALEAFFLACAAAVTPLKPVVTP